MALFRHVGEAEASPSRHPAGPAVGRDPPVPGDTVHRSCGTAERQQEDADHHHGGCRGTESGSAAAANCVRRSHRLLRRSTRAKEVNPSEFFHVLFPSTPQRPPAPRKPKVKGAHHRHNVQVGLGPEEPQPVKRIANLCICFGNKGINI